MPVSATQPPPHLDQGICERYPRILPLLEAELIRLQELNPGMTFSLDKSEGAIYWRCENGTDYGIVASYFAPKTGGDDTEPYCPVQLVLIWSSDGTPLSRKWKVAD